MLKLQAKGVAIWADKHLWTVKWSTFHLHLCIWGWQHLQKPSPKYHFIYILLLFLFRSGAPLMTLPTTGSLTDSQLPATVSNVCTTDARLGGVSRVFPPPNKNPGHAGAPLLPYSRRGAAPNVGTTVGFALVMSLSNCFGEERSHAFPWVCKVFTDCWGQI